jgi:hypothetical protein
VSLWLARQRLPRRALGNREPVGRVGQKDVRGLPDRRDSNNPSLARQADLVKPAEWCKKAFASPRCHFSGYRCASCPASSLPETAYNAETTRVHWNGD